MVDAGACRNREGKVELHRVRVAEIQTLEQLGDCYRVMPVRREVEVVGIGHRNRRAARSTGQSAAARARHAPVVRSEPDANAHRIPRPKAQQAPR